MMKVLVVDPDTELANRLSFGAQTSELSINRVECVCTALEMGLEEDAALIIVKEPLGGLDGLDLLELKRYSPKLMRVPVVVVSETARRRREFIHWGCENFILLPVDTEELLDLTFIALSHSQDRGDLNGELGEINIIDVVQLLSSTRKNGTLSLGFGAIQSNIIFHEGQAVHATYDQLFGEEAFLSVLRRAQKGGSFTFKLGTPKDSSITIEKRTDHLLLGLASMLDEQG